MEALMLYVGKVILCSGVMFLYYQLFLKDRTFHYYNRFYLVSILVVSVLLPLLRVDDFTIEPDNELYLLYLKLQNINNIKTEHHDIIYFQLIAVVAGLVSVFFSGRLIAGILKIQTFRKRYRKEVFEGIRFYQTNLPDAPFSFFRNLFWKDTILIQSDLGRQILKHEMVHIEQKHSVDKLLAEALTAVFWFNPFFYFIKKELHLIHEYLADHKTVQHADTKAFAQMLLASHFSGKVLPATSPFLNSNLKKRLTMLQKSKTQYGYVRKLAALPLTFAVAFAYFVNAKNTEIRTTNHAIATMIRNMDIPVADTTRTGNQDELVKLQQEKIAKAADRIQEEHAKAEQLKAEAARKFDELDAIRKTKGTGSEEYQAKMQDIRKISSQLDHIAAPKTPHRIDMTDKDWKNISLYFNDMRQDSVPSRIGKARTDFKIFMLPDINIDTVISNTGNMKVFTTPSGRKGFILRNQDENHFFKMDKSAFTPMKAFSIENGKGLTKKEKRKLDNLNRKQQKLDEERRAILKEKGLKYGISGIQFKTSPKAIEGPLSYSYSYQSSSPKEFKGMINVKNQNLKVFINGKASTMDEAHKLNPSDIESINVNKNNQSGEIHIKTR